jgi:hypothetical protein
VSRRSRRAASGAASGPPSAGGRSAEGPAAGGRAPGRPPSRISFGGQVALLVAVFAVGVGVAELLGAANLGVAFGIGQICFAIVLVGLLLRA